MLPFIILSIHTVVFWAIILFLHNSRKKHTLIPLYASISALMVLTHVLSSFGYNLTFFGKFFLISSTAYFTPLLLGIFLLYIFDGPRAAREGLKIMVAVSLLQASTVLLVSLEDTKQAWINSNFSTYKVYFWSLLALIIDVVLIGIGWEFISRIKKIPHFISVSLLMFLVFVADAFTFVTGVYGGESFYWSIIQSDLIVRAVLSLIMGVVIAKYLKIAKFSEEKRVKPKNFWEIINFASKDEKQIQELQSDLKKSTLLEKELRDSQETYQMALSGADAGIWEWDVKNNKTLWSNRFYELIGYDNSELEPSTDNWLSLIHQDDAKKVKDGIKAHFESDTPYRIEYRMKVKDGNYKWFLATGKAKFNSENKPTFMVGSISNIDKRKNAEKELKKKVDELTKMNNIMVDREVRMGDLKKEIAELKS